MKSIPVRARVALPLLIALAASVLSLACAPRPGGPSLAELKRMPYKQASAYGPGMADALAKSLPQRIGAAPAVLLDYLRGVDGNPRYASYAPSEAERALFAEYCGLLRPRFKEAMDAKVLGVYFIENFAGGGMTDFVFEGDGSMDLILVLNPKTLGMSLVDWIAYRDRSAYADVGEGIALASACPGGEKYRGLIHTLCHEAAHIYDYRAHVTPFVERALARASDSSGESGFTRSIWKSYAEPVAAFSIPDREALAPYGLGKALPLSAALAQYAALARTPFYSLYGSASWAEDFAEAAAWTHLREKLGVGYEVDLSRSGVEAARFVPGLVPGGAARSAALRAALD
jgi:hypothetical protein